MFDKPTRSCANRNGQLEETHANVLLLVTPKRYTNANEYCIIFGAAMQAEPLFALAVIFVPIFVRRRTYNYRKVIQ